MGVIFFENWQRRGDGCFGKLCENLIFCCKGKRRDFFIMGVDGTARVRSQ